MFNIYWQGSGDILPKDPLIWRLKPLKSVVAYANSHVQAITAEVLILARFLPSSLSQFIQLFVCKTRWL
jgi:hypothetical protein